ncbi:TPA: phosphoethanolamine transferase [Morganella morganii]|uniref:phosphoethanolamine transferase n=1 Tax=Morganella morganii TaxID=582 RepID=UPI001BD990DA|nr:phosphoethanolamine transferase [Morganella morganii]MBT0389333.1 phosphoethanolamine transferase [Morganella morganii subsp. morganii]HEJ1051811.1 phosphoethanolamine transferase [Morganella morganii]
MKNTQLIIKLFFSLLSLCIIIYTSRLMLKGVGIDHSTRNILLLSIMIIIFNSSRKAFWFIIFPIVLLHAIYSPIGSIFGIPNYQYIASIFATDLLESKEFFSQIPAGNYAYPLVIIMGVLSFRFITKKYNIDFYRNKTILCSFIFFAMINQSPLIFIKEVIKSSLQVKDELVKLNYMKEKSSWGLSSISPDSTYDNYIFIIGESARKDYLHAYGYPISNTPFMSSANGLLVDGLTSAGTNTVASLRLMLTSPNKNDWTPDYTRNFIELANSAGFETYWISNQGYISDYDTPITAVAKNSSHKYFLKYRDYASKNTSDFELLDLFEKIITENPKQKKLIVLHLYGSHPDACDRIADYKPIYTVSDKKYSYLSCYISSINKTDDFIKKVYELANAAYIKDKSSYSMIYFSDHGLAHRDIDGVINFNNNRASKLHFNIPLFMTASDIHERKVCSSFKSGLNFTNGIANWLGITNDKLDPNYSLFDCKDDPEDYGLSKIISEIPGEPDPAIDIRGK